MREEPEMSFVLDSAIPPTEALLLVAGQIKTRLADLEESRDVSSLWPWNQLIAGIDDYVREANYLVLLDPDESDELSPSEEDILQWLGGGAGLAHLATIDDYHGRLKHILGHTLNARGEPFKGDVYSAILSAGQELIERVGEAVLSGEIAEESVDVELMSDELPAGVDREFFESNWAAILDALAGRSRTSWALAFTTRLIDFDDNFLTLQFASEKDFDTFKQSGSAANDLRSVIREFSGVTVKFRGRVAFQDPDSDPGLNSSQRQSHQRVAGTQPIGTPSAVQASKGLNFENRVLDETGTIIDKSIDEESWLQARKNGITASDANRLIKLNGEKRSGYWSIVATKDEDYEAPYFESFSLGIEREPQIARKVIEDFPTENFVINNWLFENSSWPRHLATPDLVGKDTICEIKVGSAPLRQLESRYRDQLQWQMHVMDCDKVLFVVEQRHSQEMETKWVYRDQKRINQLIEAAEALLAEL